ncbi:LysR family transcriptional regulator [Devosia sp. FJ2-5-3]|jgi:LysR family transcriptional regulator of abg operon|uniref:LysR family transcriptional regulator n=1 Tax=Devosia sp. FJ2-5-3 TaxID=2976680 RepID=UPI0023D861F9|nr:LysR family transcriptional regulator [Devosia sp. FJ2-5-3]WEJ58821.1 LysR family transcriptional regulator [Devosia sp. FJ2-5-3]
MDKLLSQFLAVADAGTLSGAATALLITQPTLTINMRKLEEHIGAPLFERSSRGVTLTRYGETLYENARLMQRLYDNTLTAIIDQQHGAERGLAIGSGYSWWNMFLRDLIVRYQGEFPRAPVQVSLGNQLRLMDQMLSGDISMFLAHEIDGLSPNLGTDFVPLTRVYNAFFVHAGHPLAGAPRTQAEIDRYPRVISSLAESRHDRFFDPSRRRTRVETVFDRTHFAFRSNSLAACVDYTLATAAVLIHTHVMRDIFAADGLVEIIQRQDPRPAIAGLYVLKDRRGEDRIEDLIDRISHAARATLPPLQ